MSGPPLDLAVGAGVICARHDTVLIIRRAKAPLAGQWSIHGGRVRPGEPAADAALRELHEETGVVAQGLTPVYVADLIDERRHMVLISYGAQWLSGEPRAGGDAREAMFTPWDEAARRIAWAPTRAALEAARRAPGRQRALPGKMSLRQD